MRDDKCIFCKIAAGEIPSATLYEDKDFRVIMDVSPASKGHALILPKEHYANLYELDDELAAKVLVLAKKMITKLKDIVGCDGYNVLQNNGTAAGQTVFHFHMHLIPRYENDNVNIGWEPGSLSDDVKEMVLSGMAE
ncbi:MAG: HIT family protein [Tyzzerella sp.]|nr:HIT family protein [Tyzzerella sp.]